MAAPVARRAFPRRTQVPGPGPVGWVPVAAIPAGVWLVGNPLTPWILMWSLSVAIYAGLKWMTWNRARRLGSRPSIARSLAYLLAWPGMDAPAFLDSRRPGERPTVRELISAALNIAAGAALFWGVARLAASAAPLAAGWMGLFGLVFLLHFGAFRLVSVFWRWQGIDAPPLMRAPVSARALGEFWGQRWNTAFHVLARDFIVRPLRAKIGLPAAALAAFVASGLVHDLVISVPAQAGYGLPTAYFVVQGLALLAERSRTGRRAGLGQGIRGQVFTFAVTVIPLFGLFHPPFVLRIIVPFMHAAGAL